MTDRRSTRERILDASRTLFNQKGYKGTTLAEIARTVGIAPGNLTYHFPTKRDLARELERGVRRSVREQRERPSSGSVADQYVDYVLFAMNHTWENRFLLRDHAQLADDAPTGRPDPDMVADLDLLEGALRRMKKEGAFRRDVPLDLEVLARSLWIVSRFWMDHLREVEGLEQVGWADQERGVLHHFALLRPHLTAASRRAFEHAILRASARRALEETAA